MTVAAPAWESAQARFLDTFGRNVRAGLSTPLLQVAEIATSLPA